MAFRGLKTLTVVNIAVLLLLAMGLVDFIWVIFQQEASIRGEVARGRLFMESLTDAVLDSSSIGDLSLSPEKKERLQNRMTRSGFPCARVVDTGFRSLLLGKPSCPLDADLEGPLRNVLTTGKETTTPFGVAWAVFWRKERGVVLTVPLNSEDRIRGAASLAVPFDDLYASLRRSQKHVLIYILINAMLLTGIGFYRISRSYFDPVRRLAGRAEAYSETEDSPFVVRKEDDAFGQLSQSLNLMVRRISEDKETLKSTIASLEKANRELQSAQAEIIRTEKFATVGRLASGIAHEIGNPLGIVAGYLELLRHPQTQSGEKADYLERALRETDRMNTIIRQLLDVSRSPEKTGVLFSAHEAVRETVGILEPQPLMAGIALRMSLTASEDRVFGDPDQLRQVFLNLILNAADAIASVESRCFGNIVIATQDGASEGSGVRTSSKIRITVTDDGPGAHAENLANLFDPFFTTKAPGKGTGLGLWVSHLIVEGMGGSLRAHNRPGNGMTFEIDLPLTRDDAPPPSRKGAVVPETDTTRRGSP